MYLHLRCNVTPFLVCSHPSVRPTIMTQPTHHLSSLSTASSKLSSLSPPSLFTGETVYYKTTEKQINFNLFVDISCRSSVRMKSLGESVLASSASPVSPLARIRKVVMSSNNSTRTRINKNTEVSSLIHQDTTKVIFSDF